MITRQEKHKFQKLTISLGTCMSLVNKIQLVNIITEIVIEIREKGVKYVQS